MQRIGWQTQTGLIFVLNNRGSWNGASVRTRWANTAFLPVAWRGEDLGQPLPKQTGSDGVADFYGALLDGIVADENVARLPTLQIDTRMDGPAERAGVARQTLDFAAALAT